MADDIDPTAPLRALVLCCSLRKSPAESSSELVGFTVPANGVTYWVGEAMQSTVYQDLDPEPEKTAATTATLAGNAAHLAALLKTAPYPAA